MLSMHDIQARPQIVSLSALTDTRFNLLVNSWWKVRVKISPTEGLSPEEAPTGLVPSTYVTPLQPIKQATALYDYEATSEEEITIKEDVVYDLFEEDGDWTLVGARDKKEVGYAPTAYLEVSDHFYL